LEQDPTENKYSYCEPDLPCPRRLGTPPNQGQCQRPNTANCDYNKRFSEIPLNLFLCKAWAVGGIQELTAVFTLYRVVLNFFSAEGTPFHYHEFRGHLTYLSFLSTIKQDVPAIPKRLQQSCHCPPTGFSRICRRSSHFPTWNHR
jgi:hypothetical protein